MLWCQSERPNTIVIDSYSGSDAGGNSAIVGEGYPTLHPPLYIFTYLLTKYFRYRFDDRTFKVGDPPRLEIYERFIRDGGIFLYSNDEDQGEGDKET